MNGNDDKISSSDIKHKTRKETCKAAMVFTPFLVLIICCCVLVLLGYSKAVAASAYINLAFNRTAKIENVCKDNEYRSADAPALSGSTSDDEGTHKINYPYYGDLYAHMTINNTKVSVKNAPVYWGDSDILLDKGLCQSNYSTYIGNKGRVVIAGHNHTYFRYLYNVKKGDIVTLKTKYGTFTYKVKNTKILKDYDTSLLYYNPVGDDVPDDLIMYTCWNNGYMGLSKERIYVICDVVSKKFKN